MKKIGFLLFSLIIFSCSKEQLNQPLTRPENCDSILFTFKKNILPILNANCNFSICHATSGKGSYNFTIYNVVASRVKAGTIDYRLDLPLDDPQHMPENLRLSSCDYYIIKTWIKQGIKEK